MENSINVAELLKDCPTGMKLDCTMLNNVVFERLDFSSPKYPIVIKRLKTNTAFYLTQYGQYEAEEGYKCIIFPKGKTSWEGFVPPCKFKDGDIISNSLGTCIFKGEGVIKGTVDYYCGICGDYFNVKNSKQNPKAHYGNIINYRLAFKEEKEKLFKAIKNNGYKWNAETKTLEELIVPKFKIEDRIQNKQNGKQLTITKVCQDCYECDDRYILTFINQDQWELVPNKFDISTLKPFDKVLTRDDNSQKWSPELWSFYNNDADVYPYEVVGHTSYKYCVPYEGNEHLRGKTDDCSDFYKTWK